MKNGFSLVELSIVLVILGLLTGGILAGQNLIRASELRAINAQLEGYQSALYTFRDKYFALPGDMRNATDFWGVLAGTGADAACQNTIATSTATCNGNGDGNILTSVVGSDERIRTWQHLANAGLIEGAYTGRTDGASGTYEITPGGNMPRGKAGATDFWDLLALNTAGDGNTAFSEQNFAGPYFNYYGDVSNFNSSINPEEAWNIDTKRDDGNPVTGKVYSTPATGGHPGCTTADDATAEYDLTDTAAGCVLRFLTH